MRETTLQLSPIMTVTELAILTLDDAYLHESSGVVSKLEAIRDRIRSVSQNETLVFHRQIENPQVLYIVAEWPSIDAHNKATESGKAVLAELLTIAKPLTMIHIDLPLSAFPLDAPVMSIGRLFVAKERKEEFENFFATAKPLLQEYVAPLTLASGWRMDPSDEQKGKGEEEWILVAGWPTVEKHRDFSKTDTWERYSKIKDMIIGAEVVHSTKLTA